jgi:hypothetical protein
MPLRVRCIADPALLAILDRVATAQERTANALENLAGPGGVDDDDLARLQALLAKVQEDNLNLAAAVARHSPPPQPAAQGESNGPT